MSESDNSGCGCLILIIAICFCFQQWKEIKELKSELADTQYELRDCSRKLRDSHDALDNINNMASDRDYDYNDILNDIEYESEYEE